MITSFSLPPFLLSILMGASLVSAAVLVSVYRVNRMSAGEAMRTGESEDTIVRFSGIEGMKNITKFSLRNITRKPNRLIALLVALSLTIGISGSWLIMMDSMTGQAEDWEEDQNLGLLATFTVPVKEDQLNKLRQQPGIEDSESFTLASAESDGNSLKLLGIPPDSDMIDFIRASGDMDYGCDTCLITSKISEDMDKGSGDSITITVGSSEIELEVSGVVNDLRENTVFMEKEKVQNVTGLEGRATGMYIKTSGDVQDVKRALYSSGSISYVISSEDFNRSTDSMVEDMKGIFCFFFLMNLSLLIVTVITVSLINVLERESEYALLEMLGYKKSDSAKIIAQEIMTMGLISTSVGLPACYGFSLLLREVYRDIMFYYPILITSATITIIATSCIAFFLLSMIAPIRTLKKTDIADALRGRGIE